MSSTEWYHEYSDEFHDLTAGTIGGVSGIIVGAPFDLIKVRLQSGLSNGTAFQTAKNILKNEGVYSLWKGVLPPIIANVPINAIGFATYGNAQRYLTKHFTSGNDENIKIPQTPLQYQHDFYHTELFSRYTLPKSFTSHYEHKTTKEGQMSHFTSFQSQYTTYSTTQKSIPNWWAIFLAGCWSGFLSSIVTGPSELLKIQEQNYITNLGQKTPSSWIIAKDIVSKYGLMSLTRGYLATVWREAPSVGVYFFVYEYFKWILRREKYAPQVIIDGKIITPDESKQMFGMNNNNGNEFNRQPDIKINWQHSIDYDFYVPLIAGSLAGPASWISTYAVDIIKTRLQTLSHDEYKKTNMRMVFRDIVQQHGYKFFLTGLGTTIIRAIPVNAVTFLFYEMTLQFCKEKRVLMAQV